MPSRALTPSTEDQLLSQQPDSHHKACRQLQKPPAPNRERTEASSEADLRFLIPDHLPRDRRILKPHLPTGHPPFPTAALTLCSLLLGGEVVLPLWAPGWAGREEAQ